MLDGIRNSLADPFVLHAAAIPDRGRPQVVLLDSVLAHIVSLNKNGLAQSSFGRYQIDSRQPPAGAKLFPPHA
jgi:hypothetical protein